MVFYTIQQPSPCSRGCELYEEFASLNTDETLGGASLGSLQIVSLEGEPFHYSVTVPDFNSTLAYHLIVLEETTNRMAFRGIVRKLQQICLPIEQPLKKLAHGKTAQCLQIAVPLAQVSAC